MKFIYIVVIIFLVSSCGTKKENENNMEHNVGNFADREAVNNRDLVPNKETAIRIAEAIWEPIYGDIIYGQKPFIAELKEGEVWEVRGTLHTTEGGVAHIEIRRSDCTVLRVYHTK